MLTRAQRYAAVVYDQVNQVPEGQKKKYGAMAYKLPILVRTSGLAQALAFVHSRGSEGQMLLLNHLAQSITNTDAEGLLDSSRTAPLSEYRRLTHEALAALDWYKRFAESILKVMPGDEEETQQQQAEGDDDEHQT